jgi:hypothetical protein
MPTSSLASANPHYTFRDVAFVTVVGHGSVRSVPRGIRCPDACRAVFLRGTHLRLVAQAAPGWRFVAFRSKWCVGAPGACAFDLTSPHACDGGACPLGAFGVRAIFARGPAA